MADFSRSDVDNTPVPPPKAHELDAAPRQLSFGGSPDGPPLSPYRDPSQNASEAPTPARAPAPAPAAAEDAEAESLRLALALQEDEERYLRAQEEGEARLRRLEAERRAAERDGGAEAADDADGGLDDDDDADEEAEEGDEEDEEEEDEEIDESLALAWRLQQEDDDRALLMAMNGGVEPPAGATERTLSPSQMTYDQLLELGDNIGKVSKGTSADSLEALPTCTYAEAKRRGEGEVIVGEQCAICRMEYEDDDELRILPCRHAEHAACIDQWLLINRCCPLCQAEVGERAGGPQAAAAPAAASGPSHFSAADTDDIDDLLGI